MAKRNEGIRAPRLGIQRTLAAPGITPQQPSQPSNMAVALQQLVGAAAGTARAGAQFAAVHQELQKMDDTEKYLAAAAKDEAIPNFATVEVHNAVWQNKANQTLDTLDPATLEWGADEETTVLHRWTNAHTPAGAPPIYEATLLQGARQKFAAHGIRQARQAKATVLNDLASGVRREIATGTPESIDKALAAFNPPATAAKLSEYDMLRPIVEGARFAASNGDVARAEEAVKRLGAANHPELDEQFVAQALSARDTQRYNTLIATEAPKLTLGAPLQESLAKVKQADLSHTRTVEANEYLRSRAKENWENIFWDKHRRRIGDKASRTASIEAARADGILTGREAAMLPNQIAEADAFKGQQDHIVSVLESQAIHAPLAPAFDMARIALEVEAGYITATQANKQGTRWDMTSIVPAKRAEWAESQRIAGSVTGQAIAMIGRNAESQHEAVVGTAIADYQALSPYLREQVIDKMGPTARMRLRAAEDLEAGGSTVALHLPQIAQYDPGDITREMALSGVYGTGVTDMTGEDVASPLTATFKLIRDAYPELTGQAKAVDEPLAAAAAAYQDTAIREYQATAKLLGHTGAKEHAHTKGLAAAKRVAQPMLWGPRAWRGAGKYKHLVWVEGAPTVPDNAGDLIVQALYRTPPPGAIWTPEKMMATVENFRPAWDADAQAFFLKKVTPPYTEYVYYDSDGTRHRFETRAGADITQPAPAPTLNLRPEPPAPPRDPDAPVTAGDIISEWDLD